MSNSKSKSRQRMLNPPKQQVRERDINGQPSSSAYSSGRAETQNQSGHDYEPVPGHVNRGNQQKSISPELHGGALPLPPREHGSQTSQSQTIDSHTGSVDGSDYECLHTFVQGGNTRHSSGNSGDGRQMMPGSNKYDYATSAVYQEGPSTWPVGKNGRPLRAGGENSQACDYGNRNFPSKSEANHTHGESDEVRERRGRSNSLKTGDDHKTVARPSTDGVRRISNDQNFHPVRAGDVGSNHETNDKSGRLLQAGAMDGENPHVLQTEGYNHSQPSNETIRPLRAGADGSHSFGKGSSNMPPLRAGGDGNHSSRDSNEHYKRARASDSHLPQVPQAVGGDSHHLRPGGMGSYRARTGGNVQDLDGCDTRGYNTQHGDRRNYSYQPNHPKHSQGSYLERERECGTQSHDGVDESSQPPHYSSKERVRRHGSSGSIIEDMSGSEQHHQHPVPSSPLLRHKVMQQSHLNERSNLEVHNQGGSFLNRQIGDYDSHHEPQRRGSSSNSQPPDSHRYHSEELYKDRFQSEGQSAKPENLLGQPVEHARFEDEHSAHSDTLAQNQDIHKAQALSSGNRSQADGRQPPITVATSESSDESSDQPLDGDIDEDIMEMADIIAHEVNRDPSFKMTTVLKPVDPNLVCPTCEKKFRIGEIQKFRKHVHKCD